MNFSTMQLGVIGSIFGYFSSPQHTPQLHAQTKAYFTPDLRDKRFDETLAQLETCLDSKIFT